MTNPITGPWPTPSTQPPSADELRNGILAVLVYKRGLHKANESLERVRDRRRFCRRCLRKAKLMADIDWLRSLNAQHDAAEIAINEITAMISTNAEALLHLLSTLDKHLDRHQAGALLGIDHRHVERAGGLLHAATGDPTPDWLWVPLWRRMVDALTDDPITHRVARETMNDLFDLDLPLPPRPRPALVKEA